MKNEKLYAVAARTIFTSQNIQNTSVSDPFWKLRCRKSARPCGAKPICKSKCTKHLSLRPLLEVKTSKKCTPLWHEAHLQVKMYKTPQPRTTFGSEMWKSVRPCSAKHISKSKCTKHTKFGALLEVKIRKKCTPLWREEHFRSQNVTIRVWNLFNYNHHYTTLYSNTLHYTTTTTTPSLHSTTLHSTKLHCTQLQSITQHYTTLRYPTLHYTTLHYAALHPTILHYTTFHYTTLPFTTLHYITLD